MTGGLMVDPGAVTALIDEVAAAEILPRFGRLKDHHIQEKGPGDLVTIADERSEAALEAGLKALFPGSTCVGEEAASRDPTILSRLDGPDPVWVIDPVDGTSNFAAGKDDFGVIVALVRQGETLAGWIHRPTLGRCIWAGRGQGAWEGDTRLEVAKGAPVAKLVGHASLAFFDKGDRARLKPRLARFAETGLRRCAAVEYWGLASGAVHFSLYRRTKPWDHAAGALLVEEAGGVARRHDGAPYRPDAGADGGGILSACDAETWTAVHAETLGVIGLRLAG